MVNVHTSAYNHAIGTNKGYNIEVNKPWKDFHIYSRVWIQEKIDFFVDGRQYFSLKNEGTGNEVRP